MLSSAILVLALGQSISAGLSREFAVRIEFSHCGLETLDSVNSEFSRLIRNGVPAVAKLKLSPDRTQQLFELVTTVDVFAYPARFEMPPVSPADSFPQYAIHFMSTGRNHLVQWQDRGSTESSAVRLREMLRSVYAWSLSFPEVKKLPISEITCQ
jgi:hypothetical protein